MNELTKAEEQVMKIIWSHKKVFLKELVDAFPEPKPAYTTISTVVGVLVKKGFLNYETFGKSRQYSPSLSKEAYFKNYLAGVIGNFFSGSPSQFASFFASNEDLNLSELQEMKQMLEEKIDSLKTKGAKS